MLQPSGEADLPLESLGAQDLAQLRVEHFEGDGTVVLQVAGEIDRGHPPAPELALECVAAAQPALKLRLQVGHRAWDEGTRDGPENLVLYDTRPRGARVGYGEGSK